MSEPSDRTPSWERLWEWTDEELASYCSQAPDDVDASSEARCRWEKLTDHQMHWSPLRRLFEPERATEGS